MKPFMTFWMEKDAIICLIFATMTFPLNVVAVPSREFGNLTMTKRTEAALLFPEIEQRPLSLQVLYHLYVEPFFKVRFPFRVIGVRFTPNFDMPFDGSTFRLHQANWLKYSLTSENFS